MFSFIGNFYQKINIRTSRQAELNVVVTIPFFSLCFPSCGITLDWLMFMKLHEAELDAFRSSDDYVSEPTGQSEQANSSCPLRQNSVNRREVFLSICLNNGIGFLISLDYRVQVIWFSRWFRRPPCSLKCHYSQDK